jgi:glycosyltransferase involved in cell wall biosynthesis
MAMIHPQTGSYHSRQDVDEPHRRDKVMVIANAYPSDAALYRNGFIHRRVLAYKDAGIDVEVFYHHEPVRERSSYTFEEVNVTIGTSADLLDIARSGAHDAYLVHFAEPGRIQPLIDAAVTAPVVVWVHGFEAESWHRRWFNFVGSATAIRAALEKKNEYYVGQNAFFRWMLEECSLNLHFVNVSRWFREMIVEPDIGAAFEKSSVIPNLVDEQLFPYREKVAADRFKLLSIRPYASRKYANDLTVDAILELSNRPFFSNLEITLAGDGELFDELTSPVCDIPNVRLRKGFLSQSEVADLHAEHGVFVSPTRFDSQGVSMCEAMSSGLAVVTTNIAAIPEFVSHRGTGLLTAPESATALADAIEELYFDEELFSQLSRDGSASVQAQCGRAATVGREIALIRGLVGP